MTTKILPCLAFVLVVAFAQPTPAQTPTPAAALPAAEPEHPPADDDDCERCAARRAAAKEAEAEEEVIGLEQKWCEAEAKHDVAVLEKLEADTFVFTDSAGRVTTKKDEITTAKEGGDKIDFKLGDVKAQIYSDTAVLTGQTSFVTADDAAPYPYRWTDVFVRQANGAWQVVASQATAIRQGGKVALVPPRNGSPSRP